MSPTLTILTPAYNRSHTLPRLYQSLIKQTDSNFEWIVVDDGSVDDTRPLLFKYIEEKKIKLSYLYQTNAGKHIALNTGIKNIDTEITIIVDSDDYLTSDAVETIKKQWSLVRENNLCGISFLKGYDVEKSIGQKFENNNFIGNGIEIRYNQGISGDKAEVWKTSILKKFPFPKFEGENFLSEGIVWKRIYKQYDMLFINQIIYIAEYLPGGLTGTGRLLLIKNPQGAMLNAKLAMTKEFNISVREKNALLYIAYSFFAKKSIKEMIKYGGETLLITLNIPFGWAIYLFWKKKYKL